MRVVSQDQWQAGQERELAAWDKWFDVARGGSDKDVAEDLTARLDPKFDVAQRDFLIQYLRPNNPPGSTVKVLDVGAGPLTAFPRNWLTRTLEITAIDPLAPRFDELLKQKNIQPIVRTRQGEAERLTEQFGADQFDVVFCRNSLEQVRDPLRSLRQMLALLKPGRWLLLLQEGVRSDDESARSPWQLIEDEGELFMQAGDEKIDLQLEFADAAQIRVARAWHWPWLLAALKKQPAPASP